MRGSLPRRVLLFDVKTVYRGSRWYGSLRARSGAEQSGAVAYRASRVLPEYRAHARRYDARFTPGATPILDRLASFTPVRGLVFGVYGESSLDVHLIMGVVARLRAAASWRAFGARSEEEARSFFMAATRRHFGIFALRAFIRHRLRRIPFVGVPRHRMQAGRPADPRGGAAAYASHDFYAYQLRAVVGQAIGA